MPTTIHLVMRSGSGGDGGPVVYDAFTTDDEARRAIRAYAKVEGESREEAGYLYVERVELHETAASALGIT